MNIRDRKIKAALDLYFDNPNKDTWARYLTAIAPLADSLEDKDD